MMAAEDTVSSSRRSSCCSRSPVVIPSCLLDSSLHEKAAEITKRKHQEQEASFSGGSHDDDLMTPPDVLLEHALKQAKQLTAEVVTSGRAKGVANNAVDCWVRCTALARIVHREAPHWVRAKAHIQLGRAYLELRGLPLQALSHAVKGRDMLLAPGSSLMSHDPPFEVTCQLATAHCVVGRVYTIQGDLPKAEQELLKARKSFSKVQQLLLPSDEAGMEVETAIHSAVARLHLKQEKFSSSREEFVKSVGLTKSGFGPSTARLIPDLRGKATAELHLSLYEDAEQTLQEALDIAESEFGVEAEAVGEIVQVQGRLAAAQLKAGFPVDTKSIEDKYSRGCSIFSSAGAQLKALLCKEEWSMMLVSQPHHKERSVPMLKELVKAKKVLYGEFHTEVGDTLKVLSSVLLSLGRVDEAREQLQQARDVYECSLGARHKETSALSRSLEIISGSSETLEKQIQSKPLFKTVF